MNLHHNGTSIAAYRDLKLAQEQKRTADWVWAQGGSGSTQFEAEQALHSRHAQKRFAEIEEAWFVRKTGMRRTNPRSGKRNEVYIGTPNVRRALANPEFEAWFQKVMAWQQRIAFLEGELRTAIRSKEEAKLALYREVHRVYGLDWPEVQ